MPPNLEKRVPVGSAEVKDISKEIAPLPVRETSNTRRSQRRFEQVKPTERSKKRCFPEKVAAGWQQPHKVASSLLEHPWLPRTQRWGWRRQPHPVEKTTEGARQTGGTQLQDFQKKVTINQETGTNPGPDGNALCKIRANPDSRAL